MPPKVPKNKLHELAVLVPENTVINDSATKKNYNLGKQFATGGFGRIYTCKEVGTTKDLVIKIEPSANGPLFTEVNVFQRILKSQMVEAFKKEKKLSWIGLPVIIAGGVFNFKEDKLRFMIIPKYDISLESIREKQPKLNPKNVWEISLCILQSLEYIHEKNYTHADIKAANILLEKKGDYNSSVLVDFGLARLASSNEEKPDKKRAHNGTAIFTSSDAHKGCHASYRGDIEILAYNILYWLTGSLPWLDVEATPAKVYDKKIAFLNKLSANLNELLKDIPSSISILKDLFDIAVQTKYTSKLDFGKLFALARKGISNSNAAPRKRLSDVDTNDVDTQEKPVKRKRTVNAPKSEAIKPKSTVTKTKSDATEPKSVSTEPPCVPTKTRSVATKLKSVATESKSVATPATRKLTANPKKTSPCGTRSRPLRTPLSKSNQ